MNNPINKLNPMTIAQGIPGTSSRIQTTKKYMTFTVGMGKKGAKSIVIGNLNAVGGKNPAAVNKKAKMGKGFDDYQVKSSTRLGL